MTAWSPSGARAVGRCSGLLGLALLVLGCSAETDDDGLIVDCLPSLYDVYLSPEHARSSWGQRPIRVIVSGQDDAHTTAAVDGALQVLARYVSLHRVDGTEVPVRSRAVRPCEPSGAHDWELPRECRELADRMPYLDIVPDALLATGWYEVRIDGTVNLSCGGPIEAVPSPGALRSFVNPASAPIVARVDVCAYDGKPIKASVTLSELFDPEDLRDRLLVHADGAPCRFPQYGGPGSSYSSYVASYDCVSASGLPETLELRLVAPVRAESGGLLRLPADPLVLELDAGDLWNSCRRFETAPLYFLE